MPDFQIKATFLVSYCSQSYITVQLYLLFLREICANPLRLEFNWGSAMVSYDLDGETALLAFTATDVVGCCCCFHLDSLLSFRLKYIFTVFCVDYPSFRNICFFCNVCHSWNGNSKDIPAWQSIWMDYISHCGRFPILDQEEFVGSDDEQWKGFLLIARPDESSGSWGSELQIQPVISLSTAKNLYSL